MERAELSPKNKHYIEKHRYYELRHFCRQYDIWRKAANALLTYSKSPSQMAVLGKRRGWDDPVAKVVEARESFVRRMGLVDEALDKACADVVGIRHYLFKGVTMGLSYDKMAPEVPCGKELYYKLYREFFWILSHMRD